MTPQFLIAASILIPLLTAFGIFITGRWPNLREGITITGTFLTFGMVVQLYPIVKTGSRPALALFEVLPGAPIAFQVEPLGMLYALIAAGLWIPTAFYAIGYMRAHHEKDQTRFFICFALAIFAALGIAFSANLLTLFLFYEILTFSTYPLVTHHRDAKAKKAGRIYLGILLSTSVVFLLLAVMWTWHLSGTLDFTPGGILAGKVDEPWIAMVLLGLFAFGAGKAALMPFHRWLPAAMVAPTPVSALLHAVAIVKAGVFTILKVIVYIFGIEFLKEGDISLWLMYVAATSLLISSIIALTKDNLKARLAYSTISQLAYIVLGGALATATGVIGGGMHIAMHAMGKITLFFCAGAIYIAAHKTEISTMNGIGRRMPFTMVAFFIGSMSIIGLPPMGGSWSKWYLALGAAEGHNIIFIAVLMISSLLSIAYLMPVVVRAFFKEPDPDDHHHDEHGDEHDTHADEKHSTGGIFSDLQEAPLMCVIPLSLTALGTIALFFFANYLYRFLLPITQGG